MRFFFWYPRYMSEYKPFLSGHRPTSAETAASSDPDDIWQEVPQKYAEKFDLHVAKDETGTWRLRLDAKHPGVRISTRFARLIRLALAAEEHRLWDDAADAVLRKINCHKAVLYLLGALSRDELTASNINSDERALSLSEKKFTPIDDPQDLRTLIVASCARSALCVGQIRHALTGKIQHTFLVGEESHEGSGPARLIGFDKKDIGEEPFRVYDALQLIDEYPHMEWRFFPVEEIR